MAATNKRGVFSLETIIERQSDYNWSDISNVFAYESSSSVGPNTGYFVGGYSTSPSNQYLTQTQRVDFSNDTATAAVKGNLDSPSSADSWSGTGSMTDGYVAGANAGGSGYSNGNRIDYSNDTALATSKSEVLVNAVNRVGAVGTKDYGYWGGGTPGPKSTISRLDFSNDSGGGVSKGNLSVARYGLTGVGNQSYGYMTGGLSKSTVDRIDYSSDTSTAAVKGPLASARYGHAATGNSSYGYVAGGYPEGTTGTTLQRIDYASDTSISSPKGTMSKSKYFTTATGSGDYGYIAGGREQHDPGQTDFSSTSTIERIDFSNDTATAAPKGPLAFANRQSGGISARMNGLPNTADGSGATGGSVSNHGYFTGGAYPSVSSEKSTIDRIDFTNDTATASPKGNTAIARKNHGATGSNSHGYSVGHFPANSTTDRIDYSNDTSTASPKGKLGEPKGYVSATGNNNFGYVAGGYSPGNGSPTDRSSTVDRLDYSNDSYNCTQRANLSSGRSSGSMTGNQDFGYLCGGKVPGIVSTVERIDYSNDNATPLTKGPLSATRRYNHATGNANFGYVSGTGGYSTQIDRIDYANDTATASPKGPFSAAYSYRAATSTSSFGYFGGGQNPSSTVHTYIDRLDYSSDTTTASPKGNLSVASNKAAGVSSQECGLSNKPRRFRFYDNTPAPRGYFAGGFNNNTEGNPWYYYSTVERYNFDNDTAMASPKANLLFAGSMDLAGIATPDFSYFIGGTASFGPYPFYYKSYAERLDHSNDSMVRRGTILPTRRAQVTGNSNFGYLSGATYPGDSSSYTQLTSIIRFDFSNDDNYHSPTAAISAVSPPTLRGAVSSENFGYYAGGYISGSSSTFVERIDFSNDTANLVAKGSLSEARQSLGATGNNNFGYMAGGNTNPGSTYRTTIDRLDYSNDTANLVAKGPLSVVKKEFGGSSSNSYAYFGGGYNLIPGGNNYLSSTDRLDFSNDTATAVAKGNLSRNRSRMGATSSVVPATAPVQPPFTSPTMLAQYPSAFGYGYFVAGPGVSTVSRIDFSNDSATGVSKGPDDTSANKASTSSETHGYLLGGYSPNQATTIKRIDYANDTAASTPKGNLTSEALLAMSGQGLHTPSYGWLITPYPGGKVDRIDFANDTATAPQRSTGGDSSIRAGSTGNQSYGWRVGGSPNKTFTFRLDYENDTSALSPKGNMDSGIDWPSCFGNQNYGYYGGSPGEELPNYTRTSTHRIDYANDTATSVQKGSSPIAFGIGSGTSHNDNYGYMGTGDIYPGTFTSSIFRVDYANDTVAASPVGPVSFPAAYGGTRTRAVSAADGGMTPGSPYVT